MYATENMKSLSYFALFLQRNKTRKALVECLLWKKTCVTYDINYTEFLILHPIPLDFDSLEVDFTCKQIFSTLFLIFLPVFHWMNFLFNCECLNDSWIGHQDFSNYRVDVQPVAISLFVGQILWDKAICDGET